MCVPKQYVVIAQMTRARDKVYQDSYESLSAY